MFMSIKIIRMYSLICRVSARVQFYFFFFLMRLSWILPALNGKRRRWFRMSRFKTRVPKALARGLSACLPFAETGEAPHRSAGARCALGGGFHRATPAVKLYVGSHRHASDAKIDVRLQLTNQDR